MENRLTVVHMVQGEPYLIRFRENDKGVQYADSIKNTKYDRLSGVSKIINPITKMMAKMFTSLNVDFMGVNLTRDVGGAFANLREDEKHAFAGKVLLPRYHGKVMKAIWSSEMDQERLEQRLVVNNLLQVVSHVNMILVYQQPLLEHGQLEEFIRRHDLKQEQEL